MQEQGGGGGRSQKKKEYSEDNHMMKVIMTMNAPQQPVGFKRIKLDEVGEFKPPDKSAKEYPQYIENRKYRKLAMH